MTYDLESNSYIRKPAPSPAPAAKTVSETVTQPANRAVNNAPALTTAAQESTQKTAQVTNQVNKNGSGILKKGMQWAGRNKVGLGIAAGTAALAGGGAYLYNKAND